MRRVRFRKNTLFRLYLFALLALCVGGSWFALAFQARYHARRVDALSLRIAEMESRIALQVQSGGESTPSASASVCEMPSSVERAFKRESESLFWVEGHGYNKRYAYLDLEFRDGYRARYYFKPFPKRNELISLHRRIEHDAIAHFYYIPPQDDEEG